MCRAEVVRLREKLAPSAFIKHLGPQFRCRAEGVTGKGAEVDAREALGEAVSYLLNPLGHQAP
jgi:hypothetical protein